MAETMNNEEPNDDVEVLKPGETPVIGTGTITRTITLAIAFVLTALSGINQWLVSQGRSPFNVDQATIGNIVTYFVSLITALWAWWKPNNFTKRARRKYALAAQIQQDMLLQEAKKAYAATNLHIQEAKDGMKPKADKPQSARNEGETGSVLPQPAVVDVKAKLAEALNELD